MMMMIFEIILFILLFINNSLSLEWNCLMNKNSIDNKTKYLLYSNDQISEQCTITVEYINDQQEKQVCIAHTLTITSLPPLSLSSNHTMQTFKINSCQLSTLSQLPFSLPSSVEILDLSYNSLSKFILSFPLPSNLKSIYLDNNPNLIDINFGNNRVQRNLIGLSLRHNKKMKLSSLPPHLTQLDLTDCDLLQSSILPLLISLTKLTHLSLGDNQLERLPSIDENIQLEYLNVSNNRLTFIEDGWLHGQLHILDLKFNQIQSLEFLKNKLKFISTINRTSIYNDNDQVNVNHTLELFLNGNPLTCDCWLGAILDSSPASIIIHDLHLLQCHSHSIMDMSRNDLLCPYSRHCASDCSCCDFEACDCHFVCPSDCSCSHDAQWSRHIVKCPRTNLSDIHILLPQTITELDYEENDIEHIQPYVFIGKTSLIKLNLAKNNLQQLTNDTFCAASNLHELNLSYNPNLITIFPSINNLFQCLKHLQTIILSNDQITKEQPISDGWMILSNNNDSTVHLTKILQKSSAILSTSTLLTILMSSTNRPIRNSPTKPIIMPPTYPQEWTTFIPYTELPIIREIPFVQHHNQTLTIIVFFLLLFVLLFLILLITLAICRRRLRRHLTAELQRQRSHHYYYHHARLHQPSIKPIDNHGITGTNDSLYEQLPSLSSDSEQPFLYNEKKLNITNVPIIPPHPSTLRHHFCCHPTNHLLHIPTTNSHEYQYATNITTTTGCSTPTSQQHQCAAILLWANRLLYPTQNTYNHRDCSAHSCPSELQHLQQRLLSNQQDQTSITADNNVMRYCNNETFYVPSTTCRCNGHVQNLDTYIHPHVHR
ncbi:unnamed protein product [Adineta steineri]|uniref:Uncharacterized protein n=1 Tax=Adineta steineri TaxID=433720 RepID=A0A814TNN1_9BILA|nr:unnamed protein product [Adineta steineri]CAF1164774.1 unnamed protein product [Adineta steineri]